MTQVLGTLHFKEIPQLPDNWWEDQPRDYPDSVWKVWDRNTFYLWGSNHGNTLLYGSGYMIGGGGMAGVSHGPTRGRAHPHYIGVITMDKKDAFVNDAIFIGLEKLITAGYDVVVPTYHDEKLAKGKFKYKYSLGTGIGAGIPDWLDIQLSLFLEIKNLVSIGGSLDMPTGTYWPDLSKSKTDPPRLPLESSADLDSVITYLNQQLKTDD